MYLSVNLWEHWLSSILADVFTRNPAARMYPIWLMLMHRFLNMVNSTEKNGRSNVYDRILNPLHRWWFWWSLFIISSIPSSFLRKTALTPIFDTNTTQTIYWSLYLKFPQGIHPFSLNHHEFLFSFTLMSSVGLKTISFSYQICPSLGAMTDNALRPNLPAGSRVSHIYKRLERSPHILVSTP